MVLLDKFLNNKEELLVMVFFLECRNGKFVGVFVIANKHFELFGDRDELLIEEVFIDVANSGGVFIR